LPAIEVPAVLDLQQLNAKLPRPCSNTNLGQAAAVAAAAAVSGEE